MKYHFRIHKDEGGYWAECIELHGCRTQARTLKALTRNMHEALNVFLDEAPASELTFPLPPVRESTPNLVAIEVDTRIAFATYLRHIRRSAGLTQQEVAKKMRLKNLYSYQRLESGKTANPGLITIAQLKKIFPNFNLEELLAN